MSSLPSIRLLPPVVVAGVENEVVGAVMVGAEEDDDDGGGGEDGGDENGDGDVVVLEVVVSVAPPPPPAAFCVKSIVRRTGWHISAAEVAPTAASDVAHNSNLLALAGIVTLIGSIIGASFPRTTLTSIPMFLVETVLVAADVVDDETPPSCSRDDDGAGVVVPDGGVVRNGGVIPGVVALPVPLPASPAP